MYVVLLESYLRSLEFPVVSVMLVMLLAASGCVVVDQEPQRFVIDVQVEGLQGEDVAVLQLLPATQETADALHTLEIALPQQDVQNGSHRMSVANNIPDGAYKLVIHAPPEYLRDPKGYLFQISEAQIVRTSDRDLRFKLVPPAAQEFPPCREEGQGICMAEPIVDVSAPPKQPEPQRPLIAGEFSGLPDDTLVTIYVRTPSGQEAVWGTQRGSGSWETVVTDASGRDYVVTAEAEGYASQPISYTIHLSGTTAYVVEDSQITTEALHLDFHFEPVESS